MSSAKDWFAIQLEVTQRLLETESKRLEEAGVDVAGSKKGGVKTLAQRRLRTQYEQLNKEYENAGRELLKGKTVRSHPTLGLKSMGTKKRSSIFTDMVEKEASSSPGGGGADAAVTTNADGTTEIGSVAPIEFEDSRVKSGTLASLVDYIIPTATKAAKSKADAWYTFTFLVTSRLFLKPFELLQMIADCSELDAVAAIQLLRTWKDTCASDFRDQRMMGPFTEITKKLTAANSESATLVRTLQEGLFKALTNMETYEAKLKKEFELQLKVKRETLSSTGMSSKKDKSILSLTSNPKEAAEQLMLLEQERFSAIGANEFIETFVKDEDDAQTHNTYESSSNIEAYIAWFNRLSYFVSTEICCTEDTKKRVKLLEFWVAVGKECQAMNNYNSLMAIVAALNMNSVARMKKTWSKGGSKMKTAFEELEKILNPSSNFSNYRRAIAALADTDPCIPFFSLMVKDIYFINESSKKKLANGHLNFERLWPVSECLSSFMQYKHTVATGSLTPNDTVVTVLTTSPVCTELELFRSSVENEPPSKADAGKTMSRLRKMSSSNMSDGEGAGSSGKGSPEASM